MYIRICASFERTLVHGCWRRNYSSTVFTPVSRANLIDKSPRGKFNFGDRLRQTDLASQRFLASQLLDRKKWHIIFIILEGYSIAIHVQESLLTPTSPFAFSLLFLASRCILTQTEKFQFLFKLQSMSYRRHISVQVQGKCKLQKSLQRCRFRPFPLHSIRQFRGNFLISSISRIDRRWMETRDLIEIDENHG